MQQGAFHKAVRMYTKALELDAGNAILYSNRSAAHFNIRQFSESLEDAESAILCDDMWWKAYKRKGLALIHMQRYEEAIQALEDGLKIVGKNAEMEKNLEFARACQEQAQNLYILPEAHMMQRLESVPVFIVTDSGGQPFFVTYDDGQQVCTFYFDKKDAVATLDWIKSENPALGDTARVIHITLHQAFNLAQETQKQYYEETTRAAAEEDRRAALEAEKKMIDSKFPEKDDETKPSSPKSPGTGGQTNDDWEEVSSLTEDKDELSKGATIESKSAAEEANESTSASDSSEPKSEKASVPDDKEEEKEEIKEGEDIEDRNMDDAIIDENAPLSFQFRPELRQVQVAVELLNKNPNPPVRPILRDPPSVRKARAEAKAKAEAEAEAEAKANAEAEAEAKAKKGADSGNNADSTVESKVEDETSTSANTNAEKKIIVDAKEDPIADLDANSKMYDEVREDNDSYAKSLGTEADQKISKSTQGVESGEFKDEKKESKIDENDAIDVNVSDENNPKTDDEKNTKEDEGKIGSKTRNKIIEGSSPDTGVENNDSTKVDEAKSNSAIADVKATDNEKVATGSTSEGNSNKASEKPTGDPEKEKKAVEEKELEEKKEDAKKSDDALDDDEDVELTVDNFNGIPIFQAKGLTLLQKNKQLIPLFFSKWDLEDAWMQLKNTNSIGVPGECEIEVGTLEDVLRRMSECKTDEFDSVFFVPSREAMRAIDVKFPLDELSTPNSGARRSNVRRGGSSRAKQIHAQGGTKEEIRAAIVEDLRKYEERQKMAEVVSQIEHARRLSGVGGIGGVGFGSTSTASGSSNKTAPKKNDGIKA